jgi:hypothetical protein
MSLTLLKGAAVLAAASLPLGAAAAAQSGATAYDRNLSCAAYHLEIAGFYQSEIGQEHARSAELSEQYRASGTQWVAAAMDRAAALGKDADAVKTELLALIDRRMAANIQPGAQAELIRAHVKDTTLKADTCQRSGN